MLFTKLIWLTLVVCVCVQPTASAQGDFYRGKVLQIVVGLPPGGETRSLDEVLDQSMDTIKLER